MNAIIYRSVPVLLLFGISLLFSPTDARSQARRSESELVPLLKQHAYQATPSLNPNLQFHVREMLLEGLWEQLNAQMFDAEYRGMEGQLFKDEIFILRKGQLISLGEGTALGPEGVMSALVDKSVLYYTYSFGSGMYFSRVGCLTVVDDVAQKSESRNFSFIALFVTKQGGCVRIDSGRFARFNSYDRAETFGYPIVSGSTVRIVDEQGSELTSNPSIQFPALASPR